MKEMIISGLFIASLFSISVATAQTKGMITGRVVTEDGAGMANVTVMLLAAGSSSQRRSTTTDEEGNFRFTDLPARSYSVNVVSSREYVQAPAPATERNERRYYRLGENINITLIRGGVITGRVTGASGEPMVGMQVNAIRVRDAEGRPERASSGGLTRLTDDRGVYRIFGLQPGAYIVVANASTYYLSFASPYYGEVPTYYPSSTRDTAAEVMVNSGGEASGADIRYRGERGYVVSGRVSGVDLAGSYQSATIYLAHAMTGAIAGFSYTNPNQSGGGFAFYGVADGEYDLIADRSGDEKSDGHNSQPRRVIVRGADVIGIELKMSPRASIAGKVILEPIQNACDDKRRPAPEEIVLQARRDEAVTAKLLSVIPSLRDTLADAKGEFLIQRLDPARYRIQANPPNEDWYLKSIAASTPPPSGNARTAGSGDIARLGILLKPRERVSGVTVTFAEGAAGLRGKVVAEKPGTRLPDRLRVHLIPAGANAADDALRYAEALAQSDGAFVLKNIAPGKYWLIARSTSDAEPADSPVRPIAWDANERVKLRREAEAMKLEVELKPCQRIPDQVIRYSLK